MLKAVLRTPRMYSKYRAAQFKEKELSDLENIKKQQIECYELEQENKDFYQKLARYTAGKTFCNSDDEADRDNLEVNSSSTLEEAIEKVSVEANAIQYHESKKFLKNQ